MGSRRQPPEHLRLRLIAPAVVAGIVAALETEVVGVIGPGGVAIAFPVEQAVAELDAGGMVSVGEVEAYLDAGGLGVGLVNGEELPAHESFWFAWSQFHPDTVVWTPVGR